MRRSGELTKWLRDVRKRFDRCFSLAPHAWSRLSDL